jgi:hypothetical protein
MIGLICEDDGGEGEADEGAGAEERARVDEGGELDGGELEIHGRGWFV